MECFNTSVLTPNTKQLILIGDHQQLRPKVHSKNLEKNFNFAISLFERLVINGINYVILENQRKLRPEFAYFIRDFYEHEYYNHLVSLPSFHDVKGVQQNIFLFDHDDETNQLEVLFILEMTKYLILQGYKQEQISIVCWNSIQRSLIIDHLIQIHLTNIIVATVDNYQGEENDIVLISSVDSYPTNKLEANRVAVAFSLARIGMYVFGNFKRLCQIDNGHIWQKIVVVAESKDCFGRSLALTCQTHKNETIVEMPGDFLKNSHGGCLELCKIVKPCGHSWFQF